MFQYSSILGRSSIWDLKYTFSEQITNVTWHSMDQSRNKDLFRCFINGFHVTSQSYFLNFIPLWEWTWCHNVSLGGRWHFNCVFFVVVHVLVLPNISYTVYDITSILKVGLITGTIPKINHVGFLFHIKPVWKENQHWRCLVECVYRVRTALWKTLNCPHIHVYITGTIIDKHQSPNIYSIWSPIDKTISAFSVEYLIFSN